MSISWRILMSSLLAGTFIGCASGNCRTQQPQSMDEKELAATNAKVASALQKHIKVYKYDGSKQCGQAPAIPLADMQKDLGDIKVFSAENKGDGLMHIQSCGSPTGKANVYEIETRSLEKAKKAGFREWTFD